MNAVIYARYSSDSQREESIEGQLRECREYAERNNMTIVGTCQYTFQRWSCYCAQHIPGTRGADLQWIPRAGCQRNSGHK